MAQRKFKIWTLRLSVQTRVLLSVTTCLHALLQTFVNKLLSGLNFSHCYNSISSQIVLTLKHYSRFCFTTHYFFGICFVTSAKIKKCSIFWKKPTLDFYFYKWCKLCLFSVCCFGTMFQCQPIWYVMHDWEKNYLGFELLSLVLCQQHIYDKIC